MHPGEEMQAAPPRLMPRPLKTAVLCGAIPLVFGTSIYFAWRLTRAGWLETAGLYTIVVGLAAFVTGAIQLAAYLVEQSRTKATARRALWIQGLAVGGLLLINFPAAWIYMLSVSEIYDRYTVQVTNEGKSPVESFVVTGPGVRVEFGPIASGKTVKRHLHFGGDGTLDFTVRHGQQQSKGTLEGYVTGGLGGSKTVRVKQNGECEILNSDGTRRTP